MKDSERYMVGLDIGTTKVCCVIAYVNEDDSLDVVGLGVAKSSGMVNGRVVDIDRTVAAIKEAVGAAEVMSGVKVEAVYVGMAGDYITSKNSNGIVSPTDGIVSTKDVKRVMASALLTDIPNDCVILQTIPQEFRIDNQIGIQNPLDLNGKRLEVDVHIIMAQKAAYANIKNCVNMAGYFVNNVILESIASAEAVLTPEEKHQGTCLIDLGGGTSDVIVFSGGSVRHTFEIPSGGKALTQDLAVNFSLGESTAEELKVDYGCCHSRVLGEEVLVEVPHIGGHGVKTVGNDVVCQLLSERVNELMNLVMRRLIRDGFDNAFNNVVLTGGTSMMRGMCELAYEVFSKNARIGAPNYQGDLASQVNDPRFSTSVGLVLFGIWGYPVFNPDMVDESESGGFMGLISRIFGRKN